MFAPHLGGYSHDGYRIVATNEDCATLVSESLLADVLSEIRLTLAKEIASNPADVEPGEIDAAQRVPVSLESIAADLIRYLGLPDDGPVARYFGLAPVA